MSPSPSAPTRSFWIDILDESPIASGDLRCTDPDSTRLAEAIASELV